MGIIPRGTANAFSVALGIPTHIDDPINFATQAAEVILQVRHSRSTCLHISTSTRALVIWHDVRTRSVVQSA
jgi:diacylglycerol kinase family enzyme